jgi:ubiquitin carboxyl-terminal hydrolase 5/13
METLGIAFGEQKKTEKTIAEMNLDINLNFTLSKQLENEKNDKVMFGSSYTGMNNIGNSCYLNSVVQTLNIIPELN